MTLWKKVSQRIAVVKKIKRSLPLAERKLYFNALIELIMLYGSCAWWTASEENVNRVSALQKRAARIILDAKIRERSKLRFRRLDWLPLKAELNLKRTTLIFRRIKTENNCPSYIRELITRKLDRHTRTSRYGKHNLETKGGELSKPMEQNCGTGSKKDSIGPFKSR